jgi:hypothetical protein
MLETEYRFGADSALMRSSHWERVNLMTAAITPVGRALS